MQSVPDADTPKGVTLRDFDDFDSLRTSIFDGVKNATIKSFPINYGPIRMELHDVDYDETDPVSLSEQKKVLLENKYLTKKLRGTIKLFDTTDNDKLLEEKRLSLMRVPYLTNRGTFLHGGNEYYTIMQSRLLPGVYTRKQASGEHESMFNVKPGTGVGFRVGFEPDTTQYRLKISQANLHLYSLLKDLGTPDEELEKAWGKEILNANRNKYDARVFDKAYERLVPPKQKKLDEGREAKVASLRAALDAAKIHARVAQKNLANMFDAKIASEWEAKWQGKQAMEKLAAEKESKIEFAPDLSPDEIFEDFIKAAVSEHTHTKTLPDNSKIDILKLIELVKNRQAADVELADLDAPKKKNKATGFSESRYEAADTAYPLLVGPDNYLLDGRHRYFKLLDSGASSTKAHHVSQEDVDSVKMAATKPQHMISYVPAAALDAIRQHGLLSGDELAKPENRHLLDLSRSGEGDDSAESWLQYRESHKKENPWSTSFKGPSVLFGPPDEARITDKHPARRFKTVPVRIKMKELLAKYPDTKIHGSELTPYEDEIGKLSDEQWNAMSDEEKAPFLNRRHRDLAPDEVTDLISRAQANPAEFWKHYNDPEGKRYAGNVPHAHVITPHGKIDPEFLEFEDDKPKSNHEQLAMLIKAKMHSDQKQYGEKKRIMALMLHKNPKDFIVDSPGHMSGITHIPTGFKMHVPRNIIPAGVKRVFEEAEDDDDGGLYVNKSAAEDDFDPDLLPDDLREEYNSLYGRAGPRLAGMKKWDDSWIPDNSLGWLDWHVDYCNGKRTDDDDKQIKRWKAFKARMVPKFLKNPTAKQGMMFRLWAINPLKLIKDEKQRDKLEKEMEEYKAKAWEEYEKNK